ncbi:glycoprotein [Pepper chlorotic spot virus]|uniref:Envelopment polyprotein n=1 Tax=Pepper chlorotic spot virus TaxID=1414655 RepID=A0A1P8SKH1_9VIRU|nr:glycoprotein [Pepper chlorotic spot virus]APY22757.1 glycoprotein [Pepper chlorotic spot virus]
MKKYYLPIYFLTILLVFFASEVYLLSRTEKEQSIKNFQDRYKIDDPEDLIEPMLNTTKSSNIAVKSKKVLSRILRDDGATTIQTPATATDCDAFEKKDCLIKGVSDFNAHYQVDNGEKLIACISSSMKIFDLCQYDKDIKKITFLDFPVVPVLKLENKKVLEVGSKYFYVDKSNHPVNVNPKSGLKSPTVSKLSVRLSGDCKINQVLLRSPYQVKVKSEEKIGLIVKNVKDQKSASIKTISGDSVVNFLPEELDGNHFLLCGDKSSLVSKVDIPVRNCVSKFSDEPKKIFFCTNFRWFKWIFVLLIVAFPINWFIWKTKDSLMIWYDILGILLYPLLWALNWFWVYFPLKCRICGCFSLLTHTCSEKCVCNQNKANKEHTSECFLFRKNKREWRSLTLIQQFQYTINTKISTNFLVTITKLMIATILLSYLPRNLATNNNVCVEKCFYNMELNNLVTEKSGYKNDLETCQCMISNIITEVIFKDNNPISKSTSNNNCVSGYESCLVNNNSAQNLYVCRNGCLSYRKLSQIPDTSFDKRYKGNEFNNNLISLKTANRLRQGYLDDPGLSKLLEKESVREYNFYKSLKIEDVPPMNLLPRQSLVYSTEVDGKYRYMIEMDIKAETGSVFLLSNDGLHSPIEFMVYVKSVGVDYKIKYKYSTAKIDTTISDYLVTCTGKCEQCWNQKQKAGYLDFCVMPTSWWGCEELGCLAINEGAICGHCTNVYDLSTLVSIYQVIESHVSAEICIKTVDGYSCKTYTDKVPVQTDYYQLDMSIDLHNDYMSVDKLFAYTKHQKVLTGNIADLGDFSSSAFGHPQITIDGTPLAVPAELNQNEFTWSCTAIGEKKVNIRQCGLHTYNMIYVLSSSTDKTNLIEDENRLYMTKDFFVGKLKIVTDMPKEMYKKIPSKPVLSESKVTCSGCSQCAMGIDCNLTYTSDATFSSEISIDSCSFQSSQIGTFTGYNEKRIKAFCSEEIEGKNLKFIPEDQSELTVEIPVDEFHQVDQDTIIHFDDKSAHDENKHHSDVSLSTLWDWVKAPFNWIASFFGNFFDIVRVLLVLLVACAAIYMLSYVARLSRTYYVNKKSSDVVFNQEIPIRQSLLQNYTGIDAPRKRRSPPKNYDFDLEL